jgi:hypothetical protein
MQEIHINSAKTRYNTLNPLLTKAGALKYQKGDKTVSAVLPIYSIATLIK